MERLKAYMTSKDTVLIYRIGSLGDTVVALPCLHLIARIFPTSLRVLLTNIPVDAKAPAAAAVLGESGLIHEYLSYSIGTRNFLELFKLFWKIRRLKVKSLVYLAPLRGESVARRDERFFRLCGVKEILGVPYGELASHRYDGAADRYEAEASRLARCLAKVGDARLNAPESWDLLLSGNEQSRAADVLRPLEETPFLALGISSKQSVTDWSLENWGNLMPQLYRRFPQYALVFIGAKADRSAIDRVSALWAGKSLNLGGLLTPRESAAVIKRAKGYLGLDSGPMHLAASVGTPCVSISAGNNLPGIWFPFGETHEVIYHKTECAGCGLVVCTVERKKCILSITVNEVVAAAERTFKPPRGRDLPLLTQNSAALQAFRPCN
jgi:heptosyltransferase-3